MMKSALPLLASLALSASPAPSAPTPIEGATGILMQKHLVKLERGRRMNFVCTGRGTPTVIFEQGLGASLLTWQKVSGPVSSITRTCFYDRAGYGYSDPSTRPSTAANAVADLHALLRRANVARPVILVGHSLGGLFATLYADKFPADVAGLVLIDPSFAAQDSFTTPAERAQDAIGFRKFVADQVACAALARSGRLASEQHHECFRYAPDRTAEERAYLGYQFVRPGRYDAVRSEAESVHSADGKSDVNSLQEIAARRSFGAKPLIILTAAVAVDPKLTAAEREASARSWKSWKAGHDQLAARSTRGRNRVVPDTGHFIQQDQPQAVIDAIRTVVSEVRGR